MAGVPIQSETFEQQGRALREVLSVGAELYASRDRGQMLDTILRQAMRLTGAEAGSLFLVRDDRMEFVAARNDQVDPAQIARHLLGREMPLSDESLAGFVARTGRIMNLPDSYDLPPGAPFRINRDFDSCTGYRTQSVLALPLNCPGGQCAGVLQLLNHRDARGDVAPFPEAADNGILLMASAAAVMVHNARLHEQLWQAHLNTILRLSRVAEYRDDDTGRHIQRVSGTSELLAAAAGMGPEQAELIRYASPMHDAGKVAIPDAILLKPERLTPEQRQVMERHTIIGAEIFADPEDAVLEMAHDIALGHHERWDGHGYPHGLKGDRIPLASRVVGLADVFDAVVSKRCYKAACTLDIALGILDEDSGKHFDPDLVRAFHSVLDDVLESYPTLRIA